MRSPKVIRLAIEKPNYEYMMCTVHNSVVTKASVYEPIEIFNYMIGFEEMICRGSSAGSVARMPAENGQISKIGGWQRDDILGPARPSERHNKQSPPPPFIPHHDFYVSGNTTISNSSCSVYTVYR